ncbi:hypothetical protein [Mycobacterium montefiorense]|uniref:hypothetical protein n=1 Tax=Mycobacterium montefiorense TaxID=154654 RepID=UPI0021DD6B62|nr:hypothetical protein [Mycobacterium montefiorense]GLE52526.1 hypothetical protein ATCCBAA256_20900 [Mycobacterium montefiorense]
MTSLELTGTGTADFSEGDVYVIGSATTLICYNDFSVFLSGLDDFKKAAEASSAKTKFVYLAHGETYTFTPSA